MVERGARADVVEYDCCDCGRHILNFTYDAVPQPPLCGACLLVPGWFDVPELRRIIDPDWRPVARTMIASLFDG